MKEKEAKNPFVYGEAVVGDNFCDRTEELSKLKADLINSQKIFLISSRKLGKTSLVKTALNQLKQEGFITVFLDLEGFSSYKDFLDAYLSALTREVAAVDKILTFVRALLPGLRIEFKFDESGKPLLSLGYSRTEPELNKIARSIYELPEIIFKKRKKKVIVVFDEFQEILKLGDKQVEGLLRSSIQHQRNTGYVFAGSKRNLLTQMVSSPQRPFYKIGPIMYLRKIPKNEFFQFSKKRFIATKFKISDETIHGIIKTAENIPYYIQMLSHELWDYGILKKELDEKDIPAVLRQLINQQSQNFHLEWSRMILSKRRLLKAIAICGGDRVLSKDFLKKNELEYPSSAHRTLSALMKDGYLDREESGRYYITDLLLLEWIRNSVPK